MKMIFFRTTLIRIKRRIVVNQKEENDCYKEDVYEEDCGDPKKRDMYREDSSNKWEVFYILRRKASN